MRNGSILAAVFLAVVLVAAGYVAGSYDGPGAGAQTRHTVEVEVMFRRVGDTMQPGDRCSYGVVLAPEQWPRGSQAIVSDAGGTIVAAIDLGNAIDPEATLVNSSSGTVDDDGYCIIQSTVTVPESPFYTFAVDDIYHWTMAAQDLARRDWHMVVFFTYD